MREMLGKALKARAAAERDYHEDGDDLAEGLADGLQDLGAWLDPSDTQGVPLWFVGMVLGVVGLLGLIGWGLFL